MSIVSRKKTSGLLFFVAAISASLALFTGALSNAAAVQAAPAQQGQSQGLKITTIPAGGTATLQARAFCLDFGKTFPTQAISPTGLADSKIRDALNYAVQKGYTDGNAPQVQFAIWYLRDNTWHADQHTIAQEIVDNAGSVPMPTASGTSLVDAVNQKLVSITARFTPQTPDDLYGDGTIEIKNLSNAEVKAYMPLGVTFSAQASNGQFQDLVAYELGVNQVAVGGTPIAGTPSATITGAPTSQPTLTAITTPQTPTVATAATEVATAVATATSAGVTPVAETPTTAPTTAPIATATEMPADTPVPTATSAPQAGGSTLPNTGDGAIETAALLLVAVGCALAGLGLMLRSAPRS